jgi:signal transduction histidine kinase
MNQTADNEQKRATAEEINIASLLSHNVKSPIIYLQYVSDFLVSNWDEIEETEKLESLETINQAAKDIIVLLESLINWAKLNEGKLVPKLSSIKLNAFIETELGLHKTILHLKKLRVQVNVPLSVKVKSDPIFLQLILHNVLTNAIKFSYKNNTIKIDYSATKDSWSLSIEDEGKGMDEEELALLLAEDAESVLGTFSEQGTGIGTALTMALAKQLGGQLTIESQLGAGTRVTMTFSHLQ